MTISLVNPLHLIDHIIRFSAMEGYSKKIKSLVYIVFGYFGRKWITAVSSKRRSQLLICFIKLRKWKIKIKV